MQDVLATLEHLRRHKTEAEHLRRQRDDLLKLLRYDGPEDEIDDFIEAESVEASQS